LEALTGGQSGQSVVQDSKGDFLVFHAYNGANGRPFLQISTSLGKTAGLAPERYRRPGRRNFNE